ncbi:MAG: protein kinase [Candidatus Aminicenantes bacterium]|nr:protein kinase [Candidatus Aminicenantes bacterium]
MGAVTTECPKCRSKNTDSQQFCGDCGTRLPSIEETKASHYTTFELPKDEFPTGSTFADRYQIIEEIGIGGMGRVFKVLDKRIDEKIALKLIKPEIGSSQTTIERFRNELKTARKISHKNVCRMFDLNRHENNYYITMEFVPGGDLKQFIRRSKHLSVDTSIAIAKQICEGLDEAHKHGIVHRDLKPQNIMIDEKGNVRILDFGIAQTIKSKGITESGMTIGSPEYMSPEQVEGIEVDMRSDLYSLGIILYEMVTGVVPEKPKDPQELNAQAPEALNRIILKCMEKDKTKRYQKAEDIWSDLDQIGQIKRDPKSAHEWSNSIAVLPFVNMSADPEQEYFCDGIAEEIINALAQVENLRVLARTSAFAFKNKNVNAIELGKELHVKTILEGSVRKAGTRIRIIAQLINVSDGFHLWSEKFDHKMDDVFAIQDEITQAIFDNLKVKLLGERKESLAKRYQENPEAYNLYLKGRFFWNKRTEEALRKSIVYFKEGIEREPMSAPCYAGLSDAYHSLGYYNFLPGKDVYKEAKAAVEKALELDESLGEAYASLGCIDLFYDWDLAAAEKAFERAIHFNPNYASAHHWYAFYMTAKGRHDEALTEMKKAQELDPLSVVICTAAGWILYLGGHYDLAEEQCLRALEMDSNYHVAHVVCGLVCLQKKNYVKAISEFQRARELVKDDAGAAAYLGIAFARSGEIEKSKKMILELSELSKKKYVPPYYTAAIYAGIGDKSKAIELLNKALEERTPWLIFLKSWPIFDNLYNEPAFKSLLERIGN